MLGKVPGMQNNSVDQMEFRLALHRYLVLMLTIPYTTSVMIFSCEWRITMKSLPGYVPPGGHWKAHDDVSGLQYASRNGCISEATGAFHKQSKQLALKKRMQLPGARCDRSGEAPTNWATILSKASKSNGSLAGCCRYTIFRLALFATPLFTYLLQTALLRIGALELGIGVCPW